ncbi:MAG: hypothetical protein WCH46_06325 [bacterium]
MRLSAVFALVVLVAIIGCQTLYTYRLPTESELHKYADSLKWTYSGNTITSIPVADGMGRMFRLSVTPKTKIQVKTVYGEIYKFYIQTLVVSGEEAFIGSSQTWTGYELLNHTKVTIMAHDILEMSIISDEKAVLPIHIL